MRLLTTQSSSSRIENYISKHYEWEKVPSSLDKGDVKDIDDNYYEVKVSTLTASNSTINVLRIRLWQKIKGYNIFVIDTLKDYETTHFKLTKEEMAEEVKKSIQYRSHGTKNINKQNKNNEYSLHIKKSEKDKTFQRWIKKYKKKFRIK